MRRKPCLLGQIAAGLTVVVLGALGGAVAFKLTGSPVAVSCVFGAAGIVLGLMWGWRAAVLFVFPITCIAISLQLVEPRAVEPDFYSAAAQVAPVLILVLGLEEWSLRGQARTPLERVLFGILFGYVAVALFAALYGSAVCKTACSPKLVDVPVLWDTRWDLTTAELTVAGLVGGVAAAIVLALLGFTGEKQQGVDVAPPFRPDAQGGSSSLPSRIGRMFALLVVLRASNKGRDRY